MRNCMDEREFWLDKVDEMDDEVRGEIREHGFRICVDALTDELIIQHRWDTLTVRCRVVMDGIEVVAVIEQPGDEYGDVEGDVLEYQERSEWDTALADVREIVDDYGAGSKIAGEKNRTEGKIKEETEA